MHQKLVPDSFQFWWVAKNILCMQEIFLKIRYIERGLSKSHKKVNLILSFETCPQKVMDKIIRNKKHLELVTSSFSGYKPILERFLY